MVADGILFRLFEHHLLSYRRLSRAGRRQRLLESPLRLGAAKILSFMAERLKIALPVRAKMFWGDWMTVPFPDLLSVELFRYGVYEPDVTRAVLTHLQPGMVFFDVGAQYGYFSLLASRVVGPSGQVHAFEPAASAFRVLSANVRKRPNVWANRLAAFSHDATLPFTEYNVKIAGFSSLHAGRIDEPTLRQLDSTFNGQRSVYEVQAVSLDSYAQRVGVSPDLVKIDAEGAEPDILIGMAQILRTRRPVISLEVGDWRMRGVGHRSVQYLIDLGYAPFRVGEDGRAVRSPVRLEYQGSEGGNFLFLPHPM